MYPENNNMDPSTQSSATIFHVKPIGFGFNLEAAEDNSYMHKPSTSLNEANLENLALDESQAFIRILSNKGVNIVCCEGSAKTPDAVFPNNWFSTHAAIEGHPYRLVLYPMACPCRRQERTPRAIAAIREACGITDDSQILDLSPFECSDKFLEGTGAMVLDRINKYCYVGLSNRANQEVAEMFCAKLGYKLIAFQTFDEYEQPIFHTNVMMNVGTFFAMLCEECIKVPEELIAVRKALEETRHGAVSITLDQVRKFAGNAIELRGHNDNLLVALSETAYNALTEEQRTEILSYGVNELVPINVETIENIGGGSVRCMIGQLFTEQ